VHPILADPRKLALYLAAWIPLVLLLGGVLASTGDFTWVQSGELVLPLSAIYAFVCLSAWYLCQAAPLRTTGALYVLVAVNTAAAVSSLIWAGAVGWAVAIGLGIEPQYLRQRPILFAAGFLLFDLAAAFHYALIALEASRQAQARAMQASILAREAELKALKAQIDPHFLFNSLNSISALTASDPAKAREMCVLLSDFLRSSLKMGDRERIPLGEELALARNFLAIQQVRFGARLRIEEDIGARAGGCLALPLLLQPLVENAVTHGVATRLDGTSIRIGVSREGGRVAIRIENTFDKDARRRNGGVGLANVRKRLEVRYGDAASLEVREIEDRFRVDVLFPAEWPREEREAE
jgi:two-component system, LytTR family, sensor histidine kinase AlgZ